MLGPFPACTPKSDLWVGILEEVGGGWGGEVSSLHIWRYPNPIQGEAIHPSHSAIDEFLVQGLRTSGLN